MISTESKNKDSVLLLREGFKQIIKTCIYLIIAMLFVIILLFILTVIK